MNTPPFFLLSASFLLGIVVAVAVHRLGYWYRAMRRSHRPGHWLLVLALLWPLQGCAVSARYYKPLVYPTPNVNMADLAADTEGCRAFAQRATAEDPGVTEGAVAGALVAAVVGAALGAAIGAAWGDAGLGAILGTIEGGAAGAVGGGGSNYLEREKRKKEAINLCLRAKGYAVAN